MERILRKDGDWAVTEGFPCRVIEFSPLARVEDIKLGLPHPNQNSFANVTSSDVASVRSLPYASVTLECARIASKCKGLITHKLDFVHLWLVFEEREIKDDEEVIIFWSKKYLKWYAKLLSWFMPRFVVMVCKRGAYELLNDPDCRPELRGEARWIALRSIETWQPQVIQ